MYDSPHHTRLAPVVLRTLAAWVGHEKVVLYGVWRHCLLPWAPQAISVLGLHRHIVACPIMPAGPHLGWHPCGASGSVTDTQ